MSYSHTFDATRWTFDDLRRLMACATPHRSGDVLAGIAAQSAEERIAAQYCLADLPLRAFLDEALIPEVQDDVSDLIVKQHDPAAFAPIAHLTVGVFREWLLGADGAQISSIAWGLTPEMAAAVSKLAKTKNDPKIPGTSAHGFRTCKTSASPPSPTFRKSNVESKTRPTAELSTRANRIVEVRSVIRAIRIFCSTKPAPAAINSSI